MFIRFGSFDVGFGVTEESLFLRFLNLANGSGLEGSRAHRKGPKGTIGARFFSPGM